MRLGVTLTLGLGFAIRILAQPTPSRDLTQFSLEDLMSVQVTSVSKKEQKISKTGAAIFVITAEDIRRSGSTNIPDLLRIVPGVNVAQIDSNQWAVSIRGFNSAISNKVLVLIDGRSVYFNSFSGAFWDVIDVPPEDIERIEVIRGPGGTVWGANAMNGVINIITKHSKDTDGVLVTTGGGSKETAEGLAQYGGDIGSKGTYRIFGRYANVNNSAFSNGQRAADGWHEWHEGFRSDWNLSSRDTLMVEGDLLTSAAGGTTTATFLESPPRQADVNRRLTNIAGDVLGRWDHRLRNGAETSLQVYYNALRRDGQAGVNLSNDTVDVEFKHHLAAGARNDIVWGLDYRVAADDIRPAASYALRLNPPARTDHLFSAFVQDEIQLGRSVFLTLGSKFEHNGYTGFEYEPSAQLVWTATEQHTFWASTARAIRQPARTDFGAQFNVGVQPLPGGGTGLVTLFGNLDFTAEHVHDFEAGYRAQVNPRLSLDFTGFLTYYHELETTEPEAPFFAADQGLLVIPLKFGNLAHARSYGVEFFAHWNVTGRWKISPGYSLLQMAVKRDPSSQDPDIEQTSGNTPRHQFQIRSLFNLRRNLEWDSSLIYVSGLSHLAIPSYVRLDTRLGWWLGESVEFSIVGQNLLTPRHLEFFDTSGLVLHTEVERSVFGKITWRF
ncbi:MAG: TonB-dependent receptor [Acidobacteriota bacterium]